MTNDNENYEVGYGKPPKANQFQKGQSGNPSGRPKKMKSEKQVLMKVLAKEHTLQTPEGPVKMDGLELLITRHFKDSISGKSEAAKMMWARIDANGIGREDETETLTESDARILDQYLELFRSQKKDQADV